LQIFVNKKRKEDDTEKDRDLDRIIEIDNLVLEEKGADFWEGNL
jgi:hypothetical protein